MTKLPSVVNIPHEVPYEMIQCYNCRKVIGYIDEKVFGQLYVCVRCSKKLGKGD